VEGDEIGLALRRLVVPGPAHDVGAPGRPMRLLEQAGYDVRRPSGPDGGCAAAVFRDDSIPEE
jgi:hypothetical protein